MNIVHPITLSNDFRSSNICVSKRKEWGGEGLDKDLKFNLTKYLNYILFSMLFALLCSYYFLNSVIIIKTQRDMFFFLITKRDH